MNLWQTRSTDESSCSDDEFSIDNGDTTEFFAGLSGRETEKALRRETNSPFVNSDYIPDNQAKQIKVNIPRL